MDRITHPSAIDIGGGRRGFRSKDTIPGVPGTVVAGAWLNAMQEETMAVIEGNGLVGSDADLKQLARAVRSNGLNYVKPPQVGGTANAVTLAFPGLTFASLADLVGVPLRFVAKATATSQPTVVADTLPATSTRGPWWSLGDFVEVMYDGTIFHISIAGNLPALPIYPEVRTADGRLTMSHAAGSLAVTGATLRMFGWHDIDLSALTLPQRTFATASNKTYHLRYDRANGLRLLDLASGVYNPGALAETNAAFDSYNDDALLARVVTNGANAGTVTALANRPSPNLFVRADVLSSAAWAINSAQRVTYDGTMATNWARTPRNVSHTLSITWDSGPAQATMSGGANRQEHLIVDRYGVQWRLSSDWNDNDTISGGGHATRCNGSIFANA